mgnify:CR=1 FL=1
MTGLDHTHDPALVSWVDGAEPGSDFRVQNLPLGIFSEAKGLRRPGVAIGDYVLDLAAKLGLEEEPLIAGFLHAARLGLFELSWNVLCPGCGGVLEVGTTDASSSVTGSTVTNRSGRLSRSTTIGVRGEEKNIKRLLQA